MNVSLYDLYNHITGFNYIFKIYLPLLLTVTIHLHWHCNTEEQNLMIWVLCILRKLCIRLLLILASRVALLVKNPPAMQETPLWFLGWEGPLEKGEAAHSSILGLLWWPSEESACKVGDLGSIPGLGRSSGDGKGYPLQYCGLDYTVHGFSKSRTWLSDFHFHY